MIRLQVVHVNTGKTAHDQIAFYTFSFILSGSPDKCWLHTCNCSAYIIATRRLRLRTPMGKHNLFFIERKSQHKQKYYKFYNYMTSQNYHTTAATGNSTDNRITQKYKLPLLKFKLVTISAFTYMLSQFALSVNCRLLNPGPWTTLSQAQQTVKKRKRYH